MLKINLLPETARKTTLSPIEQFHRTPLMWIAAGAMFLLPAFELIPMRISQLQLQQLNGKIQVLEPRRMEVERVQQTLQQLRVQDAAFRGMTKGQSLWSKRLNVLSNVTPDGVWYTDLALDQKKGLIIQGSAISQGDQEMASVTRLVRDLEADTDFSSAVQEIHIESIKREPQGDFEIVQFTLACLLKDEGSP